MFKCFGSGRITKEPEMKFSEKGTAFISLPVASSTWDSGAKKKITIWYTLWVFGKSAEYVAEYGRTGTTVVWEGKIKIDPDTGNPRTYQAKDGTTRSSMEILVDSIEVVSTKEKEGND